MHFYIDSKELLEGVLSVIKALPVRTTMPILEGIFVEATSEGLKLKCSDLMLQKECILPATIEEEGFAIIPQAVFRDRPQVAGIHRGSGAQRKISRNLLRQSKSSLQCVETNEEFSPRCALREKPSPSRWIMRIAAI